MTDWKNPLDEFTLRFLVNQLTQDRERHLAMAKEMKSYDESAGEAFMLRAEECGRILQQMQRQLDRMAAASIPPDRPDRRGGNWP